MRDLGDVPRQRKTCQFGGELLVRFAPAELRRLFRNKNRLQRLFRICLKKIIELLSHLFRVDIAHHDKCEIVRDVARLVILHHLFLGKLIVNFQLSDHRQPVGVTLVSRGE